MSESKDTGRTRTVADALREAAQKPEPPASKDANGAPKDTNSTSRDANGTAASSNGASKDDHSSARRTPGPARPATGRGGDAATGSSAAKKSAPGPSASGSAGQATSSETSARSGGAAGASKKTAASPSTSTSDSSTTTNRTSSNATSGNATSSNTASSNTGANKASESSRTSAGQKPTEQKAGSSAAQAPAAQKTQQGSDQQTGSRKAAASMPPTAGEYARSTSGRTGDTSVMPAATEQRRPSQSGNAPASSREAKLRLTTIEPWSVTRLAFVVSVALMIVSVVAVTIFWVVLDLTGIWDSLNGTITNVLSDSEGSFDLTDYLGLGRLVGLTLLFSAINVVLMTAIATIAAHLYNLAAQLLGGIEVTFSDK